MLVVAALCSWFVRCHPRACDLLGAPILGLALGAGVLGLVALIDDEDERLVETLAVAGIALTVLVAVRFVLRCYCDARCDHAHAERAQKYPRVHEAGPELSPPPRPRRPMEDPRFRERLERGELDHDHGEHGHDKHEHGGR